jgi:hypothetical protein
MSYIRKRHTPSTLTHNVVPLALVIISILDGLRMSVLFNCADIVGIDLGSFMCAPIINADSPTQLCVRLS